MVAAGPATLRGRAAQTLQGAWEGRGLLSTALLPLSWTFGAIAAARRRLFVHGVRDPSRLPVPVIVVGNLVAGGAGKTPTVIAVTGLLQEHGHRPGIVSRGYGRASDAILEAGDLAGAAEVGDEPVVLRRRTGVPVVVGRDRVAAGHALLRAHPEVDVLVSDDGLQHLALDRDVDILVFDERGAGNARLLPAGPLREPLPRRLGPRQLVLYNAERPTTPLPGYLARRAIAGVTSIAAWWAGAAASATDLDALRGREVVAAAGLARPARFFAMLRTLGLRPIELPLGDHFDFAVLPWPPGTSDVVITEKDAVKLPPSRKLGTRVWVARLDFVPEPAFGAALLALLPPPSAHGPHGNTPA
jgi:tetraacyldisaccharide 4'-kinase